MPRATPFDVYYWRRKNMRGSFAVFPVKPPAQFRVNVFIQFTTSTPSPDLYPHLLRFTNSVATGNIYSPSLIVALMIAARLFPADWRQLVTPSRATAAASFVAARTVRDVARYNEAHPVVGADELLEMTQLVRDFLRPPLDVVQQAAARHDAFIDPATLEVFGRSPASSSDNDAFRLGMLLVLMRASPALGADGWHEFMRYLRWSGVVLMRPLARLNRLFFDARIASKAEVRAVLAQFGVSKLRYAQQLQVLNSSSSSSSSSKESNKL